MEGTRTVTYKNAYAWVLQAARRYEPAIPFKRPTGCVKWVRIGQSESTQQEVRESDLGVLHTSDDLPADAAGWAGQSLRSVRTLGDGACALRAVFGEMNEDGYLECPQPRELALHALDAVLQGEDAHAVRLRKNVARTSVPSHLQQQEAVLASLCREAPRSGDSGAGSRWPRSGLSFTGKQAA